MTSCRPRRTFFKNDVVIIRQLSYLCNIIFELFWSALQNSPVFSLISPLPAPLLLSFLCTVLHKLNIPTQKRPSGEERLSQDDQYRDSAPSSAAMTVSTSDSVMMSGGTKRSTFPMVQLMMTP